MDGGGCRCLFACLCIRHGVVGRFLEEGGFLETRGLIIRQERPCKHIEWGGVGAMGSYFGGG